MPQSLTIQMHRPLAGVRILGAPDGAEGGADSTREPAQGDRLDAALLEEQRHALKAIEQQKARIAQLCETVNSIVGQLDELYQETLVGNRGAIAELAVEIARKILMHKTCQGDYEIQAIVEEALKQAPTRQHVTVRVNPEDLPACQQLRQDQPDGPFAELDFVADWSIARADCLVETPKGIVKSFINEHLERIGEALEKVG